MIRTEKSDRENVTVGLRYCMVYKGFYFKKNPYIIFCLFVRLSVCPSVPPLRFLNGASYSSDEHTVVISATRRFRITRHQVERSRSKSYRVYEIMLFCTEHVLCAVETKNKNPLDWNFVNFNRRWALELDAMLDKLLMNSWAEILHAQGWQYLVNSNIEKN